MGLHLCVAQRGLAAQAFILTLELHGEQLLLDLLLDTDEARLFALHRALSRLLGELVQTDLMESLFALFTFPWVHEDGRAEGTKQISRHTCLSSHSDYILTVQRETHPLKIILSFALSVLSEGLCPEVGWAIALCHYFFVEAMC